MADKENMEFLVLTEKNATGFTSILKQSVSNYLCGFCCLSCPNAKPCMQMVCRMQTGETRFGFKQRRKQNLLIKPVRPQQT